jgi:hypothetical protein
MKKVIFYIILTLILVIALLNADELNWLRAGLLNKSSDYAQYIKDNPDGSYIAEAQKRFDERCWSEALEGNTLVHFQNYLRQNPGGKHVSAANEHIQKILWSRLAYTSLVEDFEQFINQYPDSKYVEKAKERIENIQWEKIEPAGDINDVRKFIAKYPNSKMISQAQKKLESLVWKAAESQNKQGSYEGYLSLYPSGQYAKEAQFRLTQQLEPWPVYIDSYHLYDSTAYDKDYGYIFDKQIRDFLSTIHKIKIVPEKKDALLHLQIGYALSYRDGFSGDDNISIFIESMLHDRYMIKRELALATFDIGLHLYLWDIENDCLLAYSCSSTPPEPGNAVSSRIEGKDRFLDFQVKRHVDNSIVKEFKNLVKGKDGVMNMKCDELAFFFRQDIGKPQKRVSVKFVNGSMSVYHWRDPALERYIYYQLQQSKMDIVRTYDERSYQLLVLWTRYRRPSPANQNSPLRAYGLWAHFVINEKDGKLENRKDFEKGILCDTIIKEYGLLPGEVLGEWRDNFENSFVVGDIIRRLQKPMINDE